MQVELAFGSWMPPGNGNVCCFLVIYGLYMVYIWSIYGFIYGYICLYMVYMVYPDIPVGRDDVEKFDTFLNREHVFAMFIHCRSTVYLV